MELEEAIKILRCKNIGELAVLGLIDLLDEKNDYNLNKLKEQAIEKILHYIKEESIPKAVVKKRKAF